MKPVTIDNLDIKEHVRWAQDRALLDPSLIEEAQGSHFYPDILGTSIIFPSYLDELFEWQRGMHPWAHFVPPCSLSLFNKRLFSHRLFPHITWSEREKDDDSQEEKEDDNDPQENLIDQVLRIHCTDRPSPLFERDKNSILTLLESIRSIDDMLAQISARKLQYQKG